MSWRGEQGGLHAAKAQHRVIITPSKRYYLDAYQDNPSSQPRAIGGFTLLRNAYEYEPMPKEIENTDASKCIWGIQGNLWTEYIDTERYAEYMTYPSSFWPLQRVHGAPKQVMMRLSCELFPL